MYVGQTTSYLRIRLAKHIHLAKTNNKRHLYNAIRKYGIDNFSVNILSECVTKEELDAAEIYWISYYNSTSRSNGYNYETGGSRGVNLDEDSKREISRKRMETLRLNPYKMTDETKYKIRNSKIASGYIKPIEEKRKSIRSIEKLNKPIDFEEVNKLIKSGKKLTDVIQSIGVSLKTFNKRVKREYNMKPYEYTQFILTGQTGIVKPRLEMNANPQFKGFDIEVAKSEILKYRNMKDIAMELGVSYPTFYSRFVSLCGITPVEYLQEHQKIQILVDIENKINVDEIIRSRHVTEKTINNFCLEVHGKTYSQYRRGSC